jgi:hypothetical protein
VERLLSDAELVDMRSRLDMVLLENEILEKQGRALQIELACKNSELERCAAEVQAAEGMVNVKGGDCFSAQTKVYQQLAEVRLESRLKISELRGQLGVAEEKLKKIEVVGIGECSINRDIVLRDKLRSVAGARSLLSELEAPMESEKLTQRLKVAGATLRKGSWVVDADWYLCTSDDQERKAYKLLCGEGEATVVPVASMV